MFYDRLNRVPLSNFCPAFAPVHLGVPQCSILGPMLFFMYTKPLSTIIDSHDITYHSFADDLQLQVSSPDKTTKSLYSMQSCISDSKGWVTVD